MSGTQTLKLEGAKCPSADKSKSEKSPLNWSKSPYTAIRSHLTIIDPLIEATQYVLLLIWAVSVFICAVAVSVM